MDEEQIRSRLQVVFQEIFEDSSLQIHDAMTARDLDGWDSLAHIHLVLAVEREFKVRFKTAEIQSVSNVQGLLRLIESRI